jgi:hypothetical protein
VLGIEFDLDADVFKGFGGILFGIQRENKIQQAIIGLEELGVGEGNALFGVGLNGEDADLEEIASGIFEEGGIFEFADDIFVNVAGLVSGEHFGFDLFAVNLHGEFVDAGTLGNGEQEGAFELAGIGIIELLFYGCDGNLVFDLDVGLDVIDLQGGPGVDVGRPGAWGWKNVRGSGTPVIWHVLNNDEARRECREKARQEKKPE